MEETLPAAIDILIPLTATQVKNELLIDKLHLLLRDKLEDEIDFVGIKEKLDTITTGMTEMIKRVIVTPTQEKRLKEAFLIHNEADKDSRLLKNRPLVLLRDFETLARFVNTIASVNFSKRKIKDGILHANDEDIEKALQLWENLLQLRVQLYGRSDRNLRTLSDEILLYIHRRQGDIDTKDGVLVLEAKQEFVDMKRMCAKSTFYKEIGNLVQTGRMVQTGERNAKVQVVIK